MSQQAKDFSATFIANLAGSSTNLSEILKDVFSNILKNQVVFNDEGQVLFGSSFSILAKVFTFIATPDKDRPEAGILGYDDNMIEQAKIDTATELMIELEDSPADTQFITVMLDGNTTVATATDNADAVTFTSLTTGNFNVIDFNTADDKLVLTGLAGATGTTLADLDGDIIETGPIALQVNEITGSLFINLGQDADNNVISIELAGITDASLVNIDLI